MNESVFGKEKVRNTAQARFTYIRLQHVVETGKVPRWKVVFFLRTGSLNWLSVQTRCTEKLQDMGVEDEEDQPKRPKVDESPVKEDDVLDDAV